MITQYFIGGLELQGVPKKMVILSGFEFLTSGGVFLGVKKILRTLGTKKNEVVWQNFE